MSECECRRISRFITCYKGDVYALFLRVFNGLEVNTYTETKEEYLAVIIPFETLQRQRPTYFNGRSFCIFGRNKPPQKYV